MNINELSYKELLDLRLKIENRIAALRPAYIEAENKRYHDNQKKRWEKKLEFDKNTLPKIKKYLTQNLKNGDIIKVKGARDGTGIRQFLGFGKNTLECRQILPKNRWRENDVLGQITEHGFEKVTHIKIDGDFVKIKDLIDNWLF